MTGAAASFKHRFVPAGLPSLPALLLRHGTGGDESDLLPLGQALVPHAALISPRGKILENGMPRFFRRLAMGVFDEQDLRLRSKELTEFVRAASNEYGFDAENVIAVGYSNGANIAASLLLLHPGVLRAAALFSPMVPLQPDQVPNLTGMEIFVAAGRADPIVPPENTKRLLSLLNEAGAVTAEHWHQGGHELSQSDVEAARQWFSRLIERFSESHS